MIKEIRCQFEDVKNFQNFVLAKNNFTYMKVPEPRTPYRIETLVSKVSYDKRTKETQKYVTMADKDFSPNAYNIKLERYEEIPTEADCIIYPQAESEET